MKKRIFFILSGLSLLAFSFWFLMSSEEPNQLFSQKVKVALRAVGHQLLLAHGDSTSLVMPVTSLTENTYQLSFQKPLSLDPSALVVVIDSVFQKAELPKDYLVETLACEAQEVAYSYQIVNQVENNIVPCAGRILPENCYAIHLSFKPLGTKFINKEYISYALMLCGFVLLLLGFKQKTQDEKSKALDTPAFETIGSFRFYPEQNKLVKQAEEISLSKKECELLEIFAAKPNQVIKRDELTKKVWEDHGVIVGRSLDTYISKLRKKLEADSSIKIINVHGVGYKLEINT
ncbi:winged helix-turn-helix domain-containing protein [Xanthomarina gelatinilytica]|uniref:winged helix-turn-helix domain-containing protein n=1 Tax=Xanthomarina gelatinilytica TaxID=1137281 RepID=UPI003AA91EE8